MAVCFVSVDRALLREVSRLNNRGGTRLAVRWGTECSAPLGDAPVGRSKRPILQGSSLYALVLAVKAKPLRRAVTSSLALTVPGERQSR